MLVYSSEVTHLPQFCLCNQMTLRKIKGWVHSTVDLQVWATFLPQSQFFFLSPFQVDEPRYKNCDNYQGKDDGNPMIIGGSIIWNKNIVQNVTVSEVLWESIVFRNSTFYFYTMYLNAIYFC